MGINQRLTLTVLVVLMAVRSSYADEEYVQRLWRIERERQQWNQFMSPNHGGNSSASSVYYAAIAYSPSTKKYGYSYSFGTLNGARQEALRRCPESDARIVVWAKNNHCALAIGKDGFGAGFGATAELARADALQECNQVTTESHVVQCVFSGR